MSNQTEQIIDYLKKNTKWFCDDCLSKLLDITPRQTINAICRAATKNNLISRERGICSHCHNNKIVNRTTTNSNNLIIETLPIYKKQDTTFSNEDRLAPNDFEERVKEYLKMALNQDFEEKALIVGEKKLHKFDLVSSDNSIVVECKSYTWTDGQNFPSAKISTALEAVFYLSRIIADRKIVVFQDSYNHHGESLVEMFIRRYVGLLDDVEIWTYKPGRTVADDFIEVKRTSGEIWYKKLYQI